MEGSTGIAKQTLLETGKDTVMLVDAIQESRKDITQQKLDRMVDIVVA